MPIVRFVTVPTALLLLVACGTPAPSEATFAHRIEAAHGDGSLYAKDPIHADLVVDFGGQRVLEGAFVFDAATGRCRIDPAGGAAMVFDGSDAWVDGGADAVSPMTRFHLLTWSYFLAAPWKLDDEGARLGPVESRVLRDGASVPSAKLTFDSGVGDTPDDWYIAYADPDTDALAALAYIVTYGKSTAEAEQEPHAATYDEVTVVDGLAIPSKLTFYNWSEAGGITGEPIGAATFTNIRFGPVDTATFARPAGGAEASMPD